MSQQALIRYQGKTYVIQVPPGASVAQAAVVFGQEVAKGNVAKLTPGAILANPDTLNEIQNQNIQFGDFELTQGPDFSRSERGTAGTNRSEDAAGIVGSTKQILQYPIIDLSGVTSGITAADYAIQPPALAAIADLSVEQVTSLMAAQAAEVDQDSDSISQTTGIGRYGFSALDLELAGYIKPGYAERFFNQQEIVDDNPENFVAVIDSPAIYTGRNGVSDIDVLLENPGLQASIMQDLYQVAYENLVGLGVISGNGPTADPMVQGTLLQNAITYGAEATRDWAINQPRSELAARMRQTSQQALYALQFLENRIIANEALTAQPTAFVETFDLEGEINARGREIINNPKIAVQSFQPSPQFRGEGFYK